ncbi:MAG: tripartite tricarboxylate transporter substrate binding protein [Burkholderiales bacterium]|nr:tripartite tricarboxylate transporter substrate binding protein [Burkholderiales bacterium]
MKTNAKSSVRALAIAVALAGLLVSAAVLPGAARAAEAWPARPVRLIVPFGPGGGTDIVSRLLQPSLNEILGQQIVVDNRQGAYGNIAAELAARAAPDGYTIFIANVSVASINPALFARTLRVDLTREIAGVTLLASIPDVLVVQPAFPAGNLKEFVAHVRANPGKFNFSNPLGSYSHLDTLDFARRTGMNVVLIPAQGGGQAVAGILGGEIHFAFLNAASVFPHVKSGRMKPIATTAQRRLPEYPAVPTMAEAGYPDVGGENWNGFFVPAKTPRAIVDRLFSASVEAAQRPQVKAAFAKASVPLLVSRSPEEFRGFVASQQQRWSRIIGENNVKVD